MRKLLMFALVATFAFGATALVATDADARAKSAGIVGSSHDFTDDLYSTTDPDDYDGTASRIEWGTGGVQDNNVENAGWNYRGEICRVCHAPHDKGRAAWQAWDGEDAGLLWNHSLSTTSEYGMYTSDSLQGTIADTVVGKSKLCLSCHDGTVAINAFDGNQGTNGMGNPTGLVQVGIKNYATGYEIGPDRVFGGASGSVGNDFLMGNHPISVMYTGNPKIGVNGGLHNPVDRLFGVEEEMAGAPTIDKTLENGMVQCHSCHDVHDSEGVTSVGTRLNRAGQGVATNRGGDPSGLCLSCHNK